jgi:hypothetical protein
MFGLGSHWHPVPSAVAVHVASVPRPGKLSYHPVRDVEVLQDGILSGKWIRPRKGAKRTGEMRTDSMSISSGCEYSSSSA